MQPKQKQVLQQEFGFQIDLVGALSFLNKGQACDHGNHLFWYFVNRWFKKFKS